MGILFPALSGPILTYIVNILFAVCAIPKASVFGYCLFLISSSLYRGNKVFKPLWSPLISQRIYKTQCFHY